MCRLGTGQEVNHFNREFIMRKIKSLIIFSFISLSIFYLLEPSWAFRSSWRSRFCVDGIIELGDSKPEVLSKCGEPTSIEKSEEERIKRDFPDLYVERNNRKYREPLFVKEKVTIEEWFYNFGPDEFMYYLLFEKGELISIEVGKYGY